MLFQFYIYPMYVYLNTSKSNFVFYEKGTFFHVLVPRLDLKIQLLFRHSALIGQNHLALCYSVESLKIFFPMNIKNESTV